ncbi:hypothetical protein Q1695_008167 [Nippostrongylus brasiliensis]|nr:hypothetical protein Q1695_008167 [Nippostrongylus brasiliensis]
MERGELPSSELRHIESMIASMRVNELQTVLSLFKMPKLGKKQELIHRCTELLRTPALQVQVANQVKMLVGKNGNRVAPYPIPVRGYVPNGGMMNGTSQYNSYRSGHQIIHPLQSGVVQQARTIPCRPVKNLVPMDLPFFDCHQTLLEPMELPMVVSGARTPCKQSFSFTYPRERFLSWSHSTPLPRFELQLRFYQIPLGYNSQELPDDFPLNCITRIEDHNVQLPAVIPTNKPNVEPKRPSRPVDITQYCLNVRDPSRPLRLYVEWTGDKRVWAVGIYLVYRVTSEILRDRAIGAPTTPPFGKEPINHYQNEGVTRELIRTRLSGGCDDDIAMQQLKISLLCPLSRTRIRLPARCKKCSHLQCFDMFNYLQMNEKRPTWRCPVCSDWAPYKLLIIDEYFQNVLNNVEQEAVEVELLVDGSYRTVKSECIDVDSDDMSEDVKPTVSGISSSTGTAPAAPKAKVADDDIIVLSDSDDEDGAVERAIRASISDTGPSGAPVSPPSRSRDSSIIILDDDSPPRPPPLPPKTNPPPQLPSISTPPISTTPTFGTQLGQVASCSANATIGYGSLPSVTTSHLSTLQTQAHAGITATVHHKHYTRNRSKVRPEVGFPFESYSESDCENPEENQNSMGQRWQKQALYNNNGPLSYYHQSQWSQPAASRPQYPTTSSGTLMPGSSYQSLSYKQSYSPATGPPPPPPPHTQPQGYPGPGSNLQQ